MRAKLRPATCFIFSVSGVVVLALPYGYVIEALFLLAHWCIAASRE